MANKASKEIAENDTKASDKCEGNEQYATLLATKTVLQRISFPEDINKDYICPSLPVPTALSYMGAALVLPQYVVTVQIVLQYRSSGRYDPPEIVDS